MYNSLHLAREYALSEDIIFVLRSEQFSENVARGKPVGFEKQVMSRDKFLSIFPRQMEVIVFIILQMCFATHPVLKIGKYPLFSDVMCLDQWRSSENI